MSSDASENIAEPPDIDRSQFVRRFRLGAIYRDSKSGREMKLTAIHTDRIEGCLTSDGSLFSTTPLDFVANWAEVI